MIKDYSIENMAKLRKEFKRYLADNYSHLTHHDIICSEAFFIFRTDIGITTREVFEKPNGMERCRELLEESFAGKKRKNPERESYTYCRNLKLLKEYIYQETLTPIIIKEKRIVKRLASRRDRREDIPRPCVLEVEKYLYKWNDLEDYRIQEEALDKLYVETYSSNSDLHEVIIKVSSLNDFYSTNIFKPYKVAKHIINLDIDKRLEECDVTLVNDIAKIAMDNGSYINFYSFATKYCSRHKPKDYPIYDSFVDKLLKYFRDTDNFVSFSNLELKEYVTYKRIIICFREFYGLQEFDLKQMDKYLWQLGKEKFPKKY